MYEKILKVLERFLIASLIFAFALIIYAAVIYPMIIEAKAEIGMDKSEVLKKFEGENYTLSNALHLCKNNAWTGDCSSIKTSNAVEFLILKTGIDMWFVVGFNNVGKVTYISSGET